MKLLIFSDVHGNIAALEQMLIDTSSQSIDAYIFCGDIFGYFYGQHQIIKYLKSLHNFFPVLGNHDDQFLRTLSDSNLSKFFISQYGNSYSLKIPDESTSFLKTFNTHNYLTLDNTRIGIFHGSPDNHLNGRIYPDSSISCVDNFDIIILGHTHYRMLKKHNNCIYINPGSLGQPRDDQGFSYAIYDSKSFNFSFFNVTIDCNVLIHEIQEKETSELNKTYLLRKLRKYI